MSKEEVKGPPIRTGDPRLNVKEPELKDEAFGIAKDKDGKFYLVLLHYDVETGVCKMTEKRPQETRGEAFQRFKILVAQSSVMGE